MEVGFKAIAVTASMCFGLLQPLIRSRGNLITNIPQLFVEQVLHALVQDFHRRPHRPHHTAANNPLGQLQMMKAEQVHFLVEIQQALRNIMQAKELLMSAVKIVDGEPGFLHLMIECLPKPRPNVQQGEKAG